MDAQNANARMVTKLMFRLLPVQALLVAVDSLDGFVSSFFANNYVGVEAMSAVGLYSPINTFIGALSLMLSGGTSIVCGKYLGRNQNDKLQDVFSLNVLLTSGLSFILALVFIFMSLSNLTTVFCDDEAIRPLFNAYLIGQALGFLPNIMTNQLPVFLAFENRDDRTLISSIAYVLSSIAFNFVFVQAMRMEALGLALATTVGNWIFFAVQAQYFFTKKAHLRFSFTKPEVKEVKEIVKTGLPGASTNIYQTIRGFIVNHLIVVFVGSIGITAFATVDNLLKVFWAIPMGMVTVSRLLISVSIGEEDRQTLTDIMRVMFSRFVPLMFLICLGICFAAEPLTNLFFHNPAEPVYLMTIWGFRIMPFYMPFGIIILHFICYGQAINKQFMVNLLSLLDGVVYMCVLSLLLIESYGINGIYMATVLSSVAACITILFYSCIVNRKIPQNMDELMMIPDYLGVKEEERLDLSVQTINDVVKISQMVQDFCLNLGIDEKRSYLAGLSLEEMAGNVVEHGYTKDKKKHAIDVRVVYISDEDDVVLRIKDDCKPFNPEERSRIIDKNDLSKNIGLRMVYKIAEDVQYQYLLGLNVLTIRI